VNGYRKTQKSYDELPTESTFHIARIEIVNAILKTPTRPTFTVDQFANSNKLPTLPEVALRLVQIAQQSEPDYAEVCRVIRNDPVVSGKILKTVNSALFGFCRKIEAVEEAVPKLGMTLLRTLILSFHLSKHKTEQSQLAPVFQDHWRSSLTQAVIAELIAEQFEDAEPPAYFLAGMMQDIGILAMLSEAPTDYLKHVLDRAKFPNVSAAERSHFGFSHVEVTTRILDAWGMSECFGDALPHHHNRVVPVAKGKNRRLAITLQAASQGAEMLFSSKTSTTPFATAVKEWASFLKMQMGLSEQAAETIIEEVGKRVDEYSALFSFNIGESVSSERVVTEAKLLLQEIALENQLSLIAATKAPKRVDDDALYRDSLCGLFNRRYMNEKLGEHLETSVKKRQLIAFLFLDVDKFKSINDGYGHAVGDQAIKHVAAWLGDSIRKSDLAIRLGGDEFLIVLRKLTEHDFESTAGRIARNMPPLILEDGREIAITLSVGGTLYQPEKGDSADPNWLIDQADQLMYQAKRDGGHTLSSQKFVGMT
jgi:diguanylate cyclase (GGDEF)-like protein